MAKEDESQSLNEGNIVRIRESADENMKGCMGEVITTDPLTIAVVHVLPFEAGQVKKIFDAADWDQVRKEAKEHGIKLKGTKEELGDKIKAQMKDKGRVELQERTEEAAARVAAETAHKAAEKAAAAQKAVAEAAAAHQAAAKAAAAQQAAAEAARKAEEKAAAAKHAAAEAEATEKVAAEAAREAKEDVGEKAVAREFQKGNRVTVKNKKTIDFPGRDGIVDDPPYKDDKVMVLILIGGNPLKPAIPYNETDLNLKT